MNTKFRTWLEKHFPDGKGGIKGGFPIRSDDAQDVIESLTIGLPDFVQMSTGILRLGEKVREGSFRLNRESIASTSRPEDKLERSVFQFYNNNQAPPLDGAETSAFLTAIPSFQVPLAASRADKRGKVDLLGATNEGLPAVIELKALGSRKNRGVGGLLGPVVQGLAYTLTLHHYWAGGSRFMDEWAARVDRNDLPGTLDRCRTPIIVAADQSFWETPMTWEKCRWSNFLTLSKTLEAENLPLFAARVCVAEVPFMEFSRFDQLKGSDFGTSPLRWPTPPVSPLDTSSDAV